jgi:hypothetical protein
VEFFLVFKNCVFLAKIFRMQEFQICPIFPIPEISKILTRMSIVLQLDCSGPHVIHEMQLLQHCIIDVNGADINRRLTVSSVANWGQKNLPNKIRQAAKMKRIGSAETFEICCIFASIEGD